MPKYVYKCNNCEDVFEKFHSIKTVLQDCEKCLTEYKMSGSLERVPSQVLIVSHGSKDGKIVNNSLFASQGEEGYVDRIIKTREKENGHLLIKIFLFLNNP